MNRGEWRRYTREAEIASNVCVGGGAPADAVIQQQRQRESQQALDDIPHAAHDHGGVLRITAPRIELDASPRLAAHNDPDGDPRPADQRRQQWD
jgi:hypothetical protein